MKRALFTLLFLWAGIDCRAVFIVPFPGLEALIEKADAIVVIRIEDEIAPKDDTLYSTHRCYVDQSLKGSIEPKSRIILRLMDTRSSFVPPFSRHSTHLIFLTKKRDPREPTEYRTIEYLGANIRLSPSGNEKLPEGQTTAARIQSLLTASRAYWAEQERKEEEFLRLIAEDIKDPKQAPEPAPGSVPPRAPSSQPKPD